MSAICHLNPLGFLGCGMRHLIALALLCAGLSAQTVNVRNVADEAYQLRLAGDFDGAEELLLKTLRRGQDKLKQEDSVFLQLALAGLHSDQGRYEVARKEFEKVAKSPHATYDEISRAHTGTLVCRLRMGQPASAGAYLDRAIAKHWTLLQEIATPAFAANLAAWMGLTEALRGREQASERYLRDARKLLVEKDSQTDKQFVAETWSVLARTAIVRKRWPQARTALAVALELIRKQHGETTWLVIPQLLTLAELGRLSNQRNFELDNAREAWQLLQANAVREPWVVEWTCRMYVQAARRAGEHDMLREAREACSTPAPARPPVSVEFGALQK